MLSSTVKDFKTTFSVPDVSMSLNKNIFCTSTDVNEPTKNRRRNVSKFKPVFVQIWAHLVLGLDPQC